MTGVLIEEGVLSELFRATVGLVKEAQEIKNNDPVTIES